MEAPPASGGGQTSHLASGAAVSPPSPLAGAKAKTAAMLLVSQGFDGGDDGGDTETPSAVPSGKAAELLSRLADHPGMSTEMKQVLAQRALQDSADLLRRSSAPVPLPSLAAGPVDASSERVNAVVNLTHQAFATMKENNAARAHAEEEARLAREEAERLRKQAEESHRREAEARRAAEQARRSHVRWSVMRWLLVLLVIATVPYALGVVTVVLKDLLASSSSSYAPAGIRFVDPNDGKRVPRPRMEADLAGGGSGSADEKQPSSRWNALLWPIKLIAGSPTQEEKDKNAIVVYPFVDSLNSEECILATPAEIASGRILGGKLALEDVRTSLLYHLASKPFTAVCAQHVGIPLCYCLLDMRFRQQIKLNASGGEASPASAVLQRIREGEYLEMFNPSIVGVVRNRIVQVQEENIFCTKMHFTKRFADISVQFLDEKGNQWERNFHDIHAFNLQHIEEIHRGVRTCMDDAADILLQALRGRVGGSPERDRFGRDILFSNAESFRTRRPAPPEDRPPVELPKIDSPPASEPGPDSKK